jgi:hypothetical protein
LNIPAKFAIITIALKRADRRRTASRKLQHSKDIVSADTQKSIILHHKSQSFKHLGVLMDKKHLFSRLQIKVRPKGLHSFACYILIFDFPSQLPLMSLRANTYVPIRHLYNCRETFTDVMSALQIGPFCSNKPNFRKSQMNVNKVLTTNYDKMDTWSIGKNKPNSNPIQTQFKANQTQNKPNTKPNKPNLKTLPQPVARTKEWPYEAPVFIYEIFSANGSDTRLY